MWIKGKIVKQERAIRWVLWPLLRMQPIYIPAVRKLGHKDSDVSLLSPSSRSIFHSWKPEEASQVNASAIEHCTERWKVDLQGPMTIIQKEREKRFTALLLLLLFPCLALSLSLSLSIGFCLSVSISLTHTHTQNTYTHRHLCMNEQ